MKKNLIYSLIIMILAFAACEKNEVADNKVDKSTVDNFLTVTKKYQEVKSLTKDFRSFGFKKAELKKLKSDTTWVDNWETCATVTESRLDDGTFVMVIDYGEEGCDENGTFIKGKITISWQETEVAFTCTEEYENLSYDEITLNGKTTYSSSWIEMTTGELTWEGTEDLIIDMPDETITLNGHFKDKMTDNQYIMSEGEYNYSSSQGYSFKYKITKPLVFDYSCENSCIPVEGTEEISYTEAGETTDFTIDYGDGSCDNIYTVTSNGETIEYNYDDEWNDDDN